MNIKKKKKNVSNIKNRSLDKHWGLFMANPSHSTHPRYIILFGCGRGHVVTVASSLFRSVLLTPPFYSVPTSFPFCFRHHPFFVCAQTRGVAIIVLSFSRKNVESKPAFWSGPLSADLRRWVGGGRGREKGGVEKQGLMERWANRTEVWKEREMTTDERGSRVIQKSYCHIAGVKRCLSTPAFLDWPPVQCPHCDAKTM